MEEAVTRKFVHEESSSITSLCGAVDACLSHGLKRRALGLFKTNSTTALLQKVAKNFEPAAAIYRLVVEIESSDPNNTSRLKNKQSTAASNMAKPIRYLWIRIALFEKQLVNIVDHLVQNSSNYYEKEALVADPVCGQILASLLVGPCALDYSKMKTQDHFWTDPPADELVQRHRLSSPLTNSPTTPSATRKLLGLNYKRDISAKPSSVSDDAGSPRSSAPYSPREYVESLHQNCKSTLLYGKNNVIVQPRENTEPMPGYLSLHQTPNGLVIKWTPNQLMNGSSLCENTADASSDKSMFWEFAMSVPLDEIVYLHCHQQESDGEIVLVGQDGIQHPPIRFPKGGHLLSFLSCLENGLMPYGQLDPPLWSKKGKGKVFPLLRRKAKGSIKNKENLPAQESSASTDSECEAMDYVFRIISTIDKPDSITAEMFDPKASKGGSYLWRPKNGVTQRSATSSTSSTLSSKSSHEESGSGDGQLKELKQKQSLPTDKTIQILCDTMKRQIISRAFYGWLAHCRHLRTVRTHLAGLVNPVIITVDSPTDASNGLTKEIWESLHDEEGRIETADEVRRLIYFGGCEHSIRKEVWPYLLDHYEFGSTAGERKAEQEKICQHYEVTMTEWLAVEAIVRQRDKELVAATLAKLSSESTTSTEMPLTGPKENKLTENDVFVNSSSDESEEEMDQDDENEEENDSKPAENESERENEKKNKSGVGIREYFRRQKQLDSQSSQTQNIFVTNPSVDVSPNTGNGENNIDPKNLSSDSNQAEGQLSPGHSSCISPASSGGGVYSNELLDLFSLNLHRIDKDVQRCDRNFWYFANKDNLEKLRNVMCTYVWEHLDQGYVQGMCDLVAPLLVIFDDGKCCDNDYQPVSSYSSHTTEVLTYSCFCQLMKRMAANFPHGGAMDTHFANMRSLIQILDNEIFELMHQNGDYTHFYFCYRWFLLDFKRELVYDDVFRVWEAIWASKHVSSPNFVLFIALALVEYYRDIILENNMDFTDIIKFFNEMAERHDANAVLKIARDLVLQIQTLIDN
ncbi:small G protein signaling modulator 1-like protein, partial [Dinothrombium tinctorium]